MRVPASVPSITQSWPTAAVSSIRRQRSSVSARFDCVCGPGLSFRAATAERFEYRPVSLEDLKPQIGHNVGFQAPTSTKSARARSRA